ncbi:MAG: Ankyrin repeat-like protein [Chitinophagaceae bacterium]|nr:Ankyrin repeat-like protein [Chitinophagaceae bacterium]
MKKLIVITAIVICILGFKKIRDVNISPEEIKTAINKSLPLLQSSSHTFLINAEACSSCHGQALGGIAFSLAKENGFAVSDTIINEAMDSTYNKWKSRIELLAQNDDPVAIVMSGGYDLWAFTASGYKTNKIIELLAQNIMRRQNKNGNWVSPNERPPLEYYSFTATALAVKNSQQFAPAILKNEVTERVDKARLWLTKTVPEANEEKVFQLLGLTWAQGDKDFIKQQSGKLLAVQHEDGGWSQLDSLPTDAYATGQSLYALNQSGQLAADAPAYQKGISFLLKTQYADGSWRVKTRSFPSVPFVESGFPHEGDQFISAAGSHWATMALILAAR